ncbi:MAG: hypothetical protein WC328_07045 [Kiritimatiellia bacterium]|jgi:hypothetical protein|nr:hypothetical protein [Kiritimatiellia bacterium]MDD4441961.1 hypothetical protein [Kiritimatiellia bacterium]MDX9792198.1 hypothetical protein [Kiritimatiellia bacterium]NLC82114.1 hypothetical protein [Lentisphaerota bacterium]
MSQTAQTIKPAIDGAITLLPHVRGGEEDDILFRINANAPTAFSGVTGGAFVLIAAGSSITACSDIRVMSPWPIPI